MEYVACDLCGSSSGIIIWDKAERESAGILRSVVIRDEQGNIVHGRNVICNSCGLVYVTPRMNREELARFYAEDYRKVYKGGDSFKAEKHHAQNALSIIGNLAADTLLDVGCSTGQLVQLAEKNGFTAYGVEPNREHYEIARDAGLNVENVCIEDYAPDEKFDVITMLNALEHVISPTETLTKIANLLDDGAHVLISVPHLYGRTIHIPPDAFLSNAHLFNFSRDTLADFFVKCGLVPVKFYFAVEPIGEKMYLLGRKAEAKRAFQPSCDPALPHRTREHLQKWDFAWCLKQQISQLGFN